MADPKEPSEDEIAAFVKRWSPAEAAERASYQIFLSELTQLLRLPDILAKGMDGADGYCFEKSVRFHNGDGTYSTKRVDLYRANRFILEAKQGANAAQRNTAERGSGPWERDMTAAYHQAGAYAHHLPDDEGWPPFLIVADIGYCFDIYANFSRNGRTYHPFPHARSKRIFVKDLTKPDARETLRLIWTKPKALDPSLRSEKVTREVSKSLGEMALSLEKDHAPEIISQFLMRCLFTMFAEDTQLLEKNSFTDLLARHRGNPETLRNMMDALWRDMDEGAQFSPVIEQKVRRFNGRLFHDHKALLLTAGQIDLLYKAARQDWREVEPAIFGTLLERALDPKERHKLGAHYTPRAYVERLVMVTVIEPLREDWKNALAAAEQHAAGGDAKKARAEIESFHRALCKVKVLDPACGSGNFLYVALELMKRLEGEVLTALESFGVKQDKIRTEGFEVSPEQFLGLEFSSSAAIIAEMVLWIGYLQWHIKTFGETNPPDPVLHEYHNIQTADAVLAYKNKKEHRDKEGKLVTKWDGETRIENPATGRMDPDTSKTVEDYIYESPAPAKWPEADFIVGNPPFLGGNNLRRDLGDGYTKALSKAYKGFPKSADFVMYWWHKAAELVRAGKVRRFGFITTNSIMQKFNRRVLEKHTDVKNPLSILYAVPNHPWVDAENGADVRIAMTAGIKGRRKGRLVEVTREGKNIREGQGVQIEFSERRGRIWPNLTIGVNVGNARKLRANEKLASRGVALHGKGFKVPLDKARELGLGRERRAEEIILPYLNGGDLTARSRELMLIDLFGLTAEEVRERHPRVYQHVRETVWPERKENPRDSYRENWWIFGEPRKELRKALAGLPRYVATAQTAKHRLFMFLDAGIRPDNSVISFALDDAWFMGVLSARIHVVWALAKGSNLGVGDDPRYTNSDCFDTFPFPKTDAKTKTKIRKLAEQLDKHRKDRQAENPDLTLTQMYNALAALREGRELTPKERDNKDRGLVQVLREMHDELDAAVAEAYGWPADMDDEEIRKNLVALNLVRADEEANGEVRWLRPDFQNPDGAETAAAREQTAEMELDAGAAAGAAPWPKTVKERIAALRAVLDGADKPLSAAEAAAAFKRARRADVNDLLETLVYMGAVRQVGDDKFV